MSNDHPPAPPADRPGPPPRSTSGGLAGALAGAATGAGLFWLSVLTAGTFLPPDAATVLFDGSGFVGGGLGWRRAGPLAAAVPPLVFLGLFTPLPDTLVHAAAAALAGAVGCAVDAAVRGE